MTKKRFLISSVLLSCMAVGLLIALQAFALDATAIFGPKRYDWHRGSPTVYNDTFSRCGTIGSTTLRVTNGRNEATRITSTVIRVNGVKVARENEFKKTISSFQKNISLAETTP